ncbi:surface lipoprotein assembly modifier [Chitinimonas lacunae]|uniref:Surface lipoprotein assembly modifier n=1 Tax=Chitinimonas lacunae TaxID=1963018 RepID=A0ABV8MU39_9NEIS
MGWLAWLAATATLAAIPEVEQAKRLIAAGKQQQAFELLSPQATEHAGEVEFDYLLGLAANDTGKPTQAVFAMERVLAQQPDNLLARLELARAQFMLGELEPARANFEAVKAKNPPASAIPTIDRYLKAIAARQTAPSRSNRRIYAQLGFGHDSNVNSATAESQVALPIFGGLTFDIASDGRKRSDDFANLSAGFNYLHRVDRELAWLFGGAAALRRNFDQQEFDTDSYDFSLGPAFERNDQLWLLTAQAGHFRLDGRSYRNHAGLTGQWIKNLTGTQQLILFGQAAKLRYPGQSVRDGRRLIAGAAYSQRSDSGSNGFAGLFGGREQVEDRRFDALSFRSLGLRAGTEQVINDRLKLLLSASYEDRSYRGQEVLFLKKRHDKQTDARVGLSYAFDKRWSLLPLLNYTRNSSNITINDYTRTVFELAVRADFE